MKELEKITSTLPENTVAVVNAAAKAGMKAGSFLGQTISDLIDRLFGSPEPTK